mgnify:CR=1 FL=1
MWRKLLGGIVGFELEVLAWRPTLKLSQNKPAADRIGAFTTLRALDDPGAPGEPGPGERGPCHLRRRGVDLHAHARGAGGALQHVRQVAARRAADINDELVARRRQNLVRNRSVRVALTGCGSISSILELLLD